MLYSGWLITGRSTPSLSATRITSAMRQPTVIRQAPIADLALANQVANGRHRDLQRRVVVFAVQVIDVEIVSAQARQAGVDTVEHVLAAQTAAVRDTVHRAETDLGRQHPFVAVTGNRFADDFFRTAVGVDVGGVDEIDALVPGLVDDPQGIFGAGLLARTSWCPGSGWTPADPNDPACGSS